MTSFTKSLLLFSLPLGEPKIFCCWQAEGVVIDSVREFSSDVQRGEAALLDAPAGASLQVCVVWRGGKSPSGAVPGTFGAGGCVALSGRFTGRNPEHVPRDATAGERGMWVNAK